MKIALIALFSISVIGTIVSFLTYKGEEKYCGIMPDVIRDFIEWCKTDPDEGMGF